MQNQIRDLQDKLEKFSQKAGKNDEKLKILRRWSSWKKKNPKVIGNLKKMKK